MSWSSSSVWKKRAKFSQKPLLSEAQPPALSHFCPEGQQLRVSQHTPSLYLQQCGMPRFMQHLVSSGQMREPHLSPPSADVAGVSGTNSTSKTTGVTQVPAEESQLKPAGQQCFSSEQHTAFSMGQQPYSSGDSLQQVWYSGQRCRSEHFTSLSEPVSGWDMAGSLEYQGITRLSSRTQAALDSRHV